MIVRERSAHPGSCVLVRQHDHALLSAEFAARWRTALRPAESTLYAVANHDIAWRELDGEVLWNEEKDRPYSFVDYPPEKKMPAQRRGIEAVEARDPYAGCLCSMHYSRFLLKSEDPVEVEFREGEMERQLRLREKMTEEEAENLERNFRFLRLCDGLSLFVCLNEPGGKKYPPPTPGGFEMDGARHEPVWEGERTLRLEPNPFTEAFEHALPYRVASADGRIIGEGEMEIEVTR